MTLQNICSMVDFMFTIIDLCKIFVPELEFPIMIPVFANFMRWKFGKMVAKIFPWLIWVWVSSSFFYGMDYISFSLIFMVLCLLVIEIKRTLGWFLLSQTIFTCNNYLMHWIYASSLSWAVGPPHCEREATYIWYMRHLLLHVL